MISAVLVACSATKLDRAAPAGDLYTSQLFKKSRAYAERIGAPWFILSAKHGLLDPRTIIHPYNETLTTARKQQRREWSARTAWQLRGAKREELYREKLVPLLGSGERVVMRAGNRYAEHLKPKLRILCGVKVERPMAGMGIGKQLQFLTEAMR